MFIIATKWMRLFEFKSWTIPLSHTNYGYIVAKNALFKCNMATDREEKTLIQTSCAPVKIDFLSHSARGGSVGKIHRIGILQGVFFSMNMFVLCERPFAEPCRVEQSRLLASKLVKKTTYRTYSVH